MNPTIRFGTFEDFQADSLEDQLRKHEIDSIVNRKSDPYRVEPGALDRNQKFPQSTRNNVAWKDYDVAPK